MRKLIVFLLFIFNSINSYCQDELYFLKTPKNIITLYEKDISTTHDIGGNLRGSWSTNDYYIVKETNKKLNGFYKIIIDKDNYYTGYFEKGYKRLSKTKNIFKYYNKSGAITKIELYEESFLSSRPYYYSINNYRKDAEKLKVIQIIEGRKNKKRIIKQKKCGNFYIWKMKFSRKLFANYKVPSKLIEE